MFLPEIIFTGISGSCSVHCAMLLLSRELLGYHVDLIKRMHVSSFNEMV